MQSTRHSIQTDIVPPYSYSNWELKFERSEANVVSSIWWTAAFISGRYSVTATEIKQVSLIDRKTHPLEMARYQVEYGIKEPLCVLLEARWIVVMHFTMPAPLAGSCYGIQRWRSASKQTARLNTRNDRDKLWKLTADKRLLVPSQQGIAGTTAYIAIPSAYRSVCRCPYK